MKLVIFSLLTLFMVNLSGDGLKEDELSIFIVDKKISNTKIHNLDVNIRKVKLRENPIITEQDIISYSLSNNEMELNKEAYEKIINLKIGSLFVVCVGKERIYWGMIWSGILSVSFAGKVILQPSELRLVSSSWRPEKFIIKIELGYPTEEYFEGIDLRGDKRIIDALKRAGKLNE